MKKNQPLAYKEWLKLVMKQMTHLSKPQAKVLGMWSFAIAITHCCGLSTVTVFLAELLEKPENTVKERLRQWYCDGGEKKGRKRSQIDVEKSFVPLLNWLLSWWSAEEKSLVLAADASTLGQRFTILAISVVYRGCSIPVAWKIVEATKKGSWKPHWLKLLEKLQDGIPDDWFVLVTTDRGLYAKWLYHAIQKRGWHPLNEITSDSHSQDNLTPNSGEFSLNKPVLEYSNSEYSNPTRLLSCFRRGFLIILASVIKGLPFPTGHFIPNYFPAPG